MRSMLIGLVVLMLAGCAVTPAELRQNGDPSPFTSSKAPAAFAACVQVNAENQNFQTRIRSLSDPANVETLVYVTLDGQLNAVLIADAQPAVTGSKGIVIISGRVFSPDKLRASILQGC